MSQFPHLPEKQPKKKKKPTQNTILWQRHASKMEFKTTTIKNENRNNNRLSNVLISPSQHLKVIARD